eukprot:TRINITY_DN1793_c0_g1_i1.p1 TRINITY_DN1793_c0_g1~~TRINITY_DN1793_c0_g1_i1.p1  ORF type:complete len:167 (+),score=11.72 TRINITY_DN1793_c0_g1_i1:381-881(+)
MLCLFPANGRIAVYEKVTQRLIEGIDNCGRVSVRLQSCNSSQPESEKPVAFPSDCAYNPVADTLYVRLERNDQVSVGRYYQIWVSMRDPCGNMKVTKKTIWIPYDQSSYDTAKEKDVVVLVLIIISPLSRISNILSNLFPEKVIIECYRLNAKYPHPPQMGRKKEK